MNYIQFHPIKIFSFSFFTTKSSYEITLSRDIVGNKIITFLLHTSLAQSSIVQVWKKITNLKKFATTTGGLLSREDEDQDDAASEFC